MEDEKGFPRNDKSQNENNAPKGFRFKFVVEDEKLRFPRNDKTSDENNASKGIRSRQI